MYAQQFNGIFVIEPGETINDSEGKMLEARELPKREEDMKEHPKKVSSPKFLWWDEPHSNRVTV